MNENEPISMYNSLPYLKCALRLSCVVHGLIYGRFMGFYVNVGYRNDRFFFPYKSLYCECYATMPTLADAQISSLGYLWLYEPGFKGFRT